MRIIKSNNKDFSLKIASRIKQCLNNETDLQTCISILVRETGVVISDIRLFSVQKSSSNDEQLQSVMFSLLTNLCSEKSIRLFVLDRTDLSRVLVEDLEKHKGESQLNLLGLLINLTNERSDTLQTISKKVNFIEEIQRDNVDLLVV